MSVPNTPAPGTNGSSPDDLARRVAELERELAQVRAERDKFRSAFFDWVDEVMPVDPNWQPPPPEDTIDARELLTELKKKYGRGGA